MKFDWKDDHHLISGGFNKSFEREIKLWDKRDMTTPIIQ